MSTEHAQFLRRDPSTTRVDTRRARDGWPIFLLIAVLAGAGYLGWHRDPGLAPREKIPAALKGEWVSVSGHGRYHRILVDDRTLLFFSDHAAREVFAAAEILSDPDGRTIVLHSQGLSYRLLHSIDRGLELQRLEPGAGAVSLGQFALYQRPYGQ